MTTGVDTIRWAVPAEAAGQRLVDHAREHLVVVARRRVGALVASGAIEVDGEPSRTTLELHGGELLSLTERPSSGSIVPVEAPLDILHEDATTVVVDKPAGLHVAPTGGHGSDSVIARLLWRVGARTDRPWASWRPHPVHRLDRAASGLLLVAKGARAAAALQPAVATGGLQRTYLARVIGSPPTDRGTIDRPLGPDPRFDYRQAVVATGRPAVTHWEVVERHDDVSLVRLRLETGRTHQLRAHLAWLGHPIVGDALYAADAPPEDGPPGSLAARRIALRAVRLVFPSPQGGTVRVEVGDDDPGP